MADFVGLVGCFSGALMLGFGIVWNAGGKIPGLSITRRVKAGEPAPFVGGRKEG